jgi:hypothetical protein
MNSFARSLTLALILAAGSSAGQVSPDRPSAAAQPAAPAAKPGDSMQANMQRMRSLMIRVGQTTDPAERQRLLAEHRGLMRRQIDAMKEMHCDMGMMAGGMGMMSGASKDGSPAAGAPPCHEMMEARMQMMTGMMEQMLLHEEAEQSPAQKH